MEKKIKTAKVILLEKEKLLGVPIHNRDIIYEVMEEYANQFKSTEREAELLKEIEELKSELIIQKQKVKLNFDAATDFENKCREYLNQINDLESALLFAEEAREKNNTEITSIKKQIEE
jgi:hypothetical protein